MSRSKISYVAKKALNAVQFSTAKNFYIKADYLFLKLVFDNLSNLVSSYIVINVLF